MRSRSSARPRRGCRILASSSACRTRRSRRHGTACAPLKNSELKFPVSRITVNLAPADTRKAGTTYDLPVLLGILAAAGEIKEPPGDCAFIGELSLAGDLRPVRGALPMAIAAQRAGVKRLFVPEGNASEAAFAEGIEVYGAKSVTQLLDYFRGRIELDVAAPPDVEAIRVHGPDFSEVKGQANVKRALEVAAAGGHNILMVGPPGAGKSMLGQAYSVDTAGHEPRGDAAKHRNSLRRRAHQQRTPRRRRASVQSAALHDFSRRACGGAQLQPGEMSLAHNGILFLDELPEFHRDVREALRQPLEDGTVTVSRVAGSATYPSRFMLVCAMNPCRCGWVRAPDTQVHLHQVRAQTLPRPRLGSAAGPHRHSRRGSRAGVRRTLRQGRERAVREDKRARGRRARAPAPPPRRYPPTATRTWARAKWRPPAPSRWSAPR